MDCHNNCVNCEFDYEFIIMHSYDNDILQNIPHMELI